MRDRLFVKRIEEPDKSLIFVPDRYWNAKGFTKNSAHIGEVLSVGPKVREVRPGQLIAFGRFTDYDENGIVLIQEADIMFKIDRPAKIGIDKFTHNEVGVDRAPGSIEAMFD
jgi:hypothetical protein